MNGQTPPSSGDAALSVVVMAFYALTEALERSVGFDRADFIEQHGELGGKVLSHVGEDLAEARAAFDEYAGEYRSAADFAESLHEDTGTEIPESLRYYIDWQALARDMALNSEIMVFQTGFDEVHIFWSR